MMSGFRWEVFIFSVLLMAFWHEWWTTEHRAGWGGFLYTAFATEGYTCLEIVRWAMYGDMDWAGCNSQLWVCFIWSTGTGMELE